jgi:UDP-glucose 4-epimerase
MSLRHQLSSPTRPERVVVVGAGGFVGGAIASRLRAANIDVLPLGRGDVDLLSANGGASLARLLRPSDSVVFASARAPCRDLGMLIDNMRMVQTVLSALAEVAPLHILNISSDAVYGDEPVPITEAQPAAPTTMHGVMHLAREIALGGAVGDRLAHLRPTLIYGAADPHNGYGPNRFRRLAEAGQEIVLFGQGEERRDHVLVDDVAELAVRVVLQRSTGILNVATGDVHSFRSVAELAVGLAGTGATIRGTPRVGPMPHNGYRPFDPAATRTAFPDFSYVALAEGMHHVAESTGRAGRG